MEQNSTYVYGLEILFMLRKGFLLVDMTGDCK